MGAEVSKKTDKKISEKELLYLTKASKLTPEAIDKIFADFSMISSDGFLNLAQFRKLYEKTVTKTMFDKNEKICEDIFRTFDRDQNNSISFGEFLIGYALTTQGSIKEKLEYAFDLYDINQDGFITFSELDDILSLMVVFSKQKAGFTSEIFQRMDKSNDKRISKAEFISCLMSDDCLRDIMLPFN